MHDSRGSLLVLSESRSPDLHFIVLLLRHNYSNETLLTSVSLTVAPGGYVDIVNKEDSQQERVKEKTKPRKRESTLGAARRRWLWRKKRAAGLERRRDHRGRVGLGVGGVVLGASC